MSDYMSPDRLRRLHSRATIEPRDGELQLDKSAMEECLQCRGYYSHEMELRGLRRVGKFFTNVVSDPIEQCGYYRIDESNLCDCPFWQHELIQGEQ